MQLVHQTLSTNLSPTLARISRAQLGFTLVEMAIVLVLVGLLLGGILNGRSVIRSAQTQDRIKALNEMVAAAQQFKNNYGMLPGDFSNAAASIAGLTCANGNGDGQVGTAAESTCASQSLIRAGLLRGDVLLPITVRQSTFSITSPALSGVAGLPGSWVNVVRMDQMDCDAAFRMDRAVDDGNLDTGNFRTNANTCGPGNTLQDENLPAAIPPAPPIMNVVFRIN